MSGYGQKATSSIIPTRQCLRENGLKVFPRHFPTHFCNSCADLQQHSLLPSITVIQQARQSSTLALCGQCSNPKNLVKDHKCRAFALLRLCHHHELNFESLWVCCSNYTTHSSVFSGWCHPPRPQTDLLQNHSLNPRN